MSFKGIGPKLLLALSSFVISVVIIEVAVRVIRPSAIEVNPTLLLTEYDEILGWKKRPNTSHWIETSEYRVREVINSRGLRGSEHELEKPSETRRVLLLGDSFLEGYTVGQDEVCSAVLQRRLDAREGINYEVINGGTAGYSTDQEVLFFESEGKRYQPDVTVLLFYANDVYYNGVDRYWRGFKPYFELDGDDLELHGVPVPKPLPDAHLHKEILGVGGLARAIRAADERIGRTSLAYVWVRSAVRSSPILHRLMIELGLTSVPGSFRAWNARPDAQLAQSWRVTEALLGRLKSAATEAGSQLLIFYVPSRPAIYAESWRDTSLKYGLDDTTWRPDQDQKFLESICERLEIACINPLEDFRSAAASLAKKGKSLYYKKDAHWTVEGHRLAADVIAEHL